MLHSRAVGLATVFLNLCPFVQSQQHIIPTSGDWYGWFGRAVDVSGDVLVVGAPREHGAFDDEGAVHLYRWQAGAWAHDATLSSSEAEKNHYFGDEVATDGQRILVTAARAGAPVQRRRRVYAFDITGPVPVEQHIRQAPELAWIDDHFGTSLAIEGDRMAIGAPHDNVAGIDAGVVYVYRLEGQA